MTEDLDYLHKRTMLLNNLDDLPADLARELGEPRIPNGPNVAVWAVVVVEIKVEMK